MRVIKWLDKHFEEVLLVTLLIMIACVMGLQVFMRKVVNSSLSWPEEFSRYCYVWTCFLTLAYTVRHGNMLRVNVIADLLPPVIRKILFILVNGLCLTVFSVFFINSIDVVKTLVTIGQKSTAMGIPMYLVYMCTILGFGLATLRTIQAIYKQIRDFKKDEKSGFEISKEEAMKELDAAKEDLEKSEKKEKGDNIV